MESQLLDVFQVEYQAGSEGKPLPVSCLNILDDCLIPLINRSSANMHVEDEPVVFEIIFSLLEMRPKWRVVE